MSIYAMSVLHMRPEIIGYSLTRFLRTNGAGKERGVDWFTLDNRWPGEPSAVFEALSRIVEADHFFVAKNVGGHGGYSYLIDRIKETRPFFSSTDYLLTYDPDSNPVTEGWLEAMAQVLDNDSSLPYVSLMPSWVTENRNWQKREVSGITLAEDSQPEMFNVSLWRAKCLWDGFKAYSAFYGHVESFYWHTMRMRGAYLWDFREDPCPVPHSPLYVEWKRKHAMEGYAGNFDQYWLEAGSPKL